MAAHHSLLITTCLALFSLIISISNFCHSFNPKLLNQSKYDDAGGSNGGGGGGFINDRATFYGDRKGPGPEAGMPDACGIVGLTEAPFNSKTTALAKNSLFQDAKACGTCFQVKCTTPPHCSGLPVTVVAIDSSTIQDHSFDLSGASFGAMAIPGQESQLQDLGIVDIQYQSVECNFGGAHVAFHVQTGVNPSYFATSIEYENGDAIINVELKSSQGGIWKTMEPLWGIVYKTSLDQFSDKAPFSIKLTDQSGLTAVAQDVIPAGYVGDAIYISNVNFAV